MENDSILKVVQEKIDERMKNMFRMGDRPIEREMASIAGAYIERNGIFRRLLDAVPRDSEDAWFMNLDIDVTKIKAQAFSRRGSLEPRDVMLSGSIDDSSSFIHVFEIASCSSMKLSDLARPSFSPLKIIEAMAAALMKGEEENFLQILDNSVENGKSPVIETNEMTADLIAQRLTVSSHCVVMSPIMYERIINRGLTPAWKTKPIDKGTKRKWEAARIIADGRSVSVHLTECAGARVYILKHPGECGVRADTGNPTVICDPEPKKLRASIIGFVEFGVNLTPDCCTIISSSEQMLDPVAQES